VSCNFELHATPICSIVMQAADSGRSITTPWRPPGGRTPGVVHRCKAGGITRADPIPGSGGFARYPLGVDLEELSHQSLQADPEDGPLLILAVRAGGADDRRCRPVDTLT
jgi:hypothetical protein